MVDYAKETTLKKSLKYVEYALFEHLYFLFLCDICFILSIEFLSSHLFSVNPLQFFVTLFAIPRALT